MSFFSVHQLTAGYGGQPILENISFQADAGCITGILGGNGSGKTTLLKAICGIVPHEGSCVLESTPLEQLSPRPLARLCSYIPQRSGISIDISALDVVLMGFNPHLGLLESPSAAMKKAAEAALEQVGLSGKAQENYLHLSEGQKQLCILARTLVSGSRLLLLDEPESALDFRFRYRMLALLQTWVKQEQRAALVTLHDPMLALNCCDKLILLADGCVCGTLLPRTDSLEKMARMLEEIYGSIELQRCCTPSGRTHLVMLKEDA